jgi:hypothetical protein
VAMGRLGILASADDGTIVCDVDLHQLDRAWQTIRLQTVESSLALLSGA